MIRSWVALLALSAGTSVSLVAEELPAPNVPTPPQPGLFAPELPLPDLSVPGDKPAANPPTVVAPDSLLPNPTPSPVPAPSVVSPMNPNPSGSASTKKPPSLPNENSLAPQSTPDSNVPDDLKWRYKWHQGQWWYWSPDERWVIWNQNQWIPYDPATYQAPPGFAAPGPQVVTQTSNYPLPMPESYPTTEISVPQSYYLAPSPVYVSPTPYAFGASSYYGPYGPAASYYNRRSGVSISIGTPAYGYPGYYSGRGVSIGFGF